jgi:hypothetical protein
VQFQRLGCAVQRERRGDKLFFYCRGEPFIYMREWLTNIKGVTKGLKHTKIYSVKCGMCKM